MSGLPTSGRKGLPGARRLHLARGENLELLTAENLEHVASGAPCHDRRSGATPVCGVPVNAVSTAARLDGGVGHLKRDVGAVSAFTARPRFCQS